MPRNMPPAVWLTTSGPSPLVAGPPTYIASSKLPSPARPGNSEPEPGIWHIGYIVRVFRLFCWPARVIAVQDVLMGDQDGRPRRARTDVLPMSRRSACHAQDRWSAAPCVDQSNIYALLCISLTTADDRLVIRFGRAERQLDTADCYTGRTGVRADDPVRISAWLATSL
jgi:hypothetical protein